MNFSRMLKAIAFLGLITTGFSASAAPVSCTWQYAGGGGGGGTWVNAEVCLQYLYNGSQIVGANHIATRTKTFYNGYLQQCVISTASGYSYSGSCESPSFFTSTPVTTTSSSSSSSSSAPASGTVLFSGYCNYLDNSCMEGNGRRCGAMNGNFVVSNWNYTCTAK
ncbi:hypothetical protein D0C16_10320 [Cellvibrio sp. KY-GH-1]|uniref:hypothetical protein n=1 Tax=Cellvibrio sp. KY-GH-1 TaxID=2303332 RepID=UPI001243B69F|nr:hypothetical protein [Cellvibrio sp. KY-GH-1]QEY16340.1 hypothetical protein D0C16_10320 [Cellvibrio sp. KY-GH-1]